MTLTMVIATRGRPHLLRETVARTLPNMSRSDSTLMVCVDDDDVQTVRMLGVMPRDDRLILSVKPREDSRGEKYDRALKEAPADVYLPAVDYAPIITEGFDQMLLDAASIWPDRIGVVYTPMVDEIIPGLQAMTAKFVQKVGRIYNDEYPFWFIDHEVCDLACMIGRVTFADIEVDVSKRPGKTTRMRDLDFWTVYYDAMTLERRVKARAIIDDPEFEGPDWLKDQLRAWFPLTEMRSYRRNHEVRQNAVLYEGARGSQDAPDAGYIRAKTKAEAKLNALCERLSAEAA